MNIKNKSKNSELVRINSDYHKQLKIYAAQNDETIAHILNNLIKQFIENEQAKDLVTNQSK